MLLCALGSESLSESMRSLCESVRVPVTTASSFQREVLLAFFLRKVSMCGADEIESLEPYLQTRFNDRAMRILCKSNIRDAFRLLLTITVGRVWVSSTSPRLPRGIEAVSKERRVAAIILLVWTHQCGSRLNEAVELVSKEGGHLSMEATAGVLKWVNAMPGIQKTVELLF
jgi:hypothetical protein